MMHKISGRVIRGEGYGQKLGFPTANLERRSFSRIKQNIKLGVYAGFAEFELQGTSYNLPAGIVIGPIDKKGLPKIEAHIIGFNGNLYGKILSIYLNIYLRPFKKYTTEEDLKKQIEQDVDKIKRIL